jgi:hypothetical protein
MAHTGLTPDEIVEHGRRIYEDRIRAAVERDHHGEYLVINVETSEYELDVDDLAASKRAKARFGDAPLFTMRIGHAAAYRLGGRFRVGS